MIVDERYVSYINSLDTGNSDFLNEVEEYALGTNVPIVRKEMQTFLKAMLMLKQPKSILEVGTAIGFSSLLMAENTSGDCHITTIENYEKRIPIARDNFIRSGYGDRITLLEGDATDILEEMDGSFDMIFMDAAKGQYINFFENVMRLLKPGGLLISDNVLQDGDIIESRFAVTRRNRTIHKRMREYLYVLTHDKRLTTSIITLGDGVALSVKEL